MGIFTADLCDAHMDRVADGRVSVLAPGVFQSYGKLRQFHGPVTTLKIFEDNSLVREALERPGAGGVLVVDGGGSMRRGLLGDNIAAAARDNLWVGIIINGCIRDVDEINAINIGVKALGSHPLKSLKQGQGEKDVQVILAGSKISPGDWIYADADGILVSHGEKIHTLQKP